jgi:hypothetical protein
MAGTVAALAVALFLAVVVGGGIIVIAFSVRHEDRRYTLAGDAPGLLSRTARRLNGVGRRDLDPEYFPASRRAAA